VSQLSINSNNSTWDLPTDLQSDWYIDYESKHINFIFRTKILTHNVETITCKWPTTWWDAVKERWFPNWLQEIFPVLYTKKTLKADIFFPYIRIPWGKTVHQIHIRDYIENDL